MSIARLISASCILALLLTAQSFAAPSSDLADAAMNRNKDAVRSLLQKKADVNATQIDGTTALHWAVRADDLETAELLIRAGANASATNRYGVTPLYLATVNGNAAIIQRLLEADADPNSVDPAGETALMTAARTGAPEALRVLLDRGAKVNAPEPEFQETALMLAVRENHPAAVKLLIERGAELNAHTRIGATPAFRPPCKGTGCGSEGVGINRGGLRDR